MLLGDQCKVVVNLQWLRRSGLQVGNHIGPMTEE